MLLNETVTYSYLQIFSKRRTQRQNSKKYIEIQLNSREFVSLFFTVRLENERILPRQDALDTYFTEVPIDG